MTPGSRKPGAIRWVCWLPLLSLVAIEVYVGGFEGWGAWASAPLLLLPGLLSLAIVIPGLVDCAAEIRAGALRPATLLFTLVAAVPILWLAIRRFFT